MLYDVFISNNVAQICNILRRSSVISLLYNILLTKILYISKLMVLHALFLC